MTIEIANRVAVVTGGAGGIGSALARRLTAAGARVLVADLDDDRVNTVVEELRAGASDDVAGFVGDVASEPGVRALIERAESTLGPIDLFFANAGVPGHGGIEADDADWDLAIQVNVMAHVRAARLLVPGWLERGGGCFVATASAAGLLTQVGAAPYSVTKHAAVAHAEWLSVTYGDAGIQVACLCPMGVDTAMLNDGLGSEDQGQRRSARVVTSSGAVLSPDDVALATLEGVRAGRFLILPHPEVATFVQRKADDHERWLAGMRRLAASLG
jgi:NAD(P)-dependent dehydrogenase (short-subunit alcohol dehydrogenase family)